MPRRRGEGRRGRQGAVKQSTHGDCVREFARRRQRSTREVAERTDEPGVATGLAWTSVGGDILFIEATRMHGKGKLQLTGQLGDVMKESAQAALSYVRTRAEARSHVAEDFLENGDVHIHFPAGAVPKDGPSAGVTMITALVSLLTGHPRAPRRGDDRRDHAARQGAAGRRHQGEGAGGAPRGHQARDPARALRSATSTRCRKRCATSSSSSRCTKMDEVLLAALEEPEKLDLKAGTEPRRSERAKRKKGKPRDRMTARPRRVLVTVRVLAPDDRYHRIDCLRL